MRTYPNDILIIAVILVLLRIPQVVSPVFHHDLSKENKFEPYFVLNYELVTNYGITTNYGIYISIISAEYDSWSEIHPVRE